MTEQDGHAMLVARCKALEEIALKYAERYEVVISGECDLAEAKETLEREVFALAGWRH